MPDSNGVPTLKSDAYAQARAIIEQGQVAQQAVQSGEQFPPRFTLPPDAQSEPGGGFLPVTNLGTSSGRRLMPRGPDSIPPAIDNGGAGFMANMRANYADDPQTKMRVYAQALFPNEPDAIQRFGLLDGEIVYVNDARQVVKAEGGDMGDALGRAAASAPEFLGGMAAVGATGPLGAVALGGLGAAGGLAGKKIIANQALGEPQTAGGNARDLVVEGAISGAGGLLGIKTARGITSKAGGATLRDAQRFDAGAVRALQHRIKTATGIDIDVADATNFASVKALKRYVLQHPSESADIIQAQQLLKEGQVKEAITNLIELTAKQSNSTLQGEGGINAAKAAIDVAKSARTAATSPMYQQAFRSGAQVDVSRIAASVDATLDTAKGPQEQALRKVQSMLRRKPTAEELAQYPPDPITGAVDAPTWVPEDRIEALHNVKIAIDDMLESEGSTSIAKSVRRELTGIQSDLVSSLGNASPEYEAGRALFEKISRDTIDPLENSLVGVLARMRPGSETKAGLKLLSEGFQDPQQIRVARRAIGNDEAWNGLVRQALASHFNTALGATQARNTAVAGKFLSQVAKTPKQREAMRQALPGQARAVFDDVLEALEYVARGDVGQGSPTNMFGEISDALKGQTNKIARFARNPIDTTIDATLAGNESQFVEQNAIRIANALTDPNQIRQLHELRALPAGAERSIRILSVIGFTAGPRTVANATQTQTRETQLPPRLLQDPTQ